MKTMQASGSKTFYGLLLLLFCLGLVGPVFSQAKDEEEVERMKYGLSQSEWEKYQKSGISKKKLERLLNYGITFNEYSSKPWISLGVSESKWIEERGKGLKNEDIKSFHQTSSTGDADLIRGFFLPGFEQIRHRRYITGGIMVAIIPASIALFFLLPEEVPPSALWADSAHTIRLETTYKKRVGFLFPIPGGMVWSVVDVFLHRPAQEPAKDTEGEEESLLSPSRLELGVDWRNRGLNLNYTLSF